MPELVPEPMLDLRTIGLAARLNRVCEQFDPILPPESLSVEYVNRRAEHIGGERVLAVLFIGRTDLVRSGAFDQLLARKPALLSLFLQHRGIGQIELVLPDARKCLAQEWIGIVARLDCCDHEAVDEARSE